MENSEELYTVSDFSDDYEYNQLCQKALELYFKKTNYALHQEITQFIKRKLKKAKHSSIVENQEAYKMLHDSDLISKHKKKRTKDHEFHEWLNKIITESIEEAFKNKEIEANKHKEDLDKTNQELNLAIKKAKIAACANILTGIVSAAITAGITLAIAYK
jgi:hypothetical protein